MRAFIRRIGPAVAMLGLVIGAGGTAQAGLVLQVNSGTRALTAGDNTFGWSFTTNQEIVVTALAVHDPTGSSGVRLYNGSGVILASVTPSTADPLLGGAIPFYTRAVTPVTLAANETFYIAQGISSNTTHFHILTDMPVTSPLITYLAAVSTSSGIGMNATPTTDAFGGRLSPGLFGPNFVAEAAVQPVPEPSTLAGGVLGVALAGGGWWARRRRQVA